MRGRPGGAGRVTSGAQVTPNASRGEVWWGGWDSNPGPADYESPVPPPGRSSYSGSLPRVQVNGSRSPGHSSDSGTLRDARSRNAHAIRLPPCGLTCANSIVPRTDHGLNAPDSRRPRSPRCSRRPGPGCCCSALGLREDEAAHRAVVTPRRAPRPRLPQALHQARVPGVDPLHGRPRPTPHQRARRRSARSARTSASARMAPPPARSCPTGASTAPGPARTPRSG